jgi:putative ABC transport system permease protein
VRDWTAFVREHLPLPQLTPERESRIVRELAAQLEDVYREALARGATHEDADALACTQITDWDRMARDVRQAEARHVRPRVERITNHLQEHGSATRGGRFMLAHVLTDARYALRQLRKTPGFTVVAVLTLAFGIGATSAIFSIINAVMLRPLPYPEPDRLVSVFEIVPQFGRFSVAPANFLDWRQQTRVFEHVSAYANGTDTYVGSDGPDRVPMSSVSWDLFDTLRVPPSMGRGFRADEDAPNQNAVIVISDGMWKRRFGADPNILGRSVTLSGVPLTVIGVMPPGFYFPSRDVEFWRPIALNPANATRGGHFLGVVARLASGVSTEQAAAEMRTVAQRLGTAYPGTNANESAETVEMRELIVGPVRPMLFTLMAAVAVVILIACANVANLLLVRASVREKEIAIRTALGAGRQRLMVQMLTESLVLAAVGGALGIMLAWAAVDPIQRLGVGSIPRVLDVALDRKVLGFAVMLSLATGVLFGLAPAWQASRGGIGAILKEGGRSSSTSGGRWVRNTLLVAEVALSLVLLVGASLLLRSFAKITGIDPGFRADNVLAFRVALPASSYREAHHRIAFYDRLLEKLAASPGIESAGMIQTAPMRGSYTLAFSVQGRPPARPGEGPSANYRAVSPRYFATLGIPLQRGRLFNDHDSATTTKVALVDEAFVRRHFPDEDPIGHRIDIGNGGDSFCEIVGVVGGVHHGGLDSDVDPTMYVPFKQDVFSSMWVMAKTTADPTAQANLVRAVVRDIDGTLPAFSIMPLTNMVSESIARRRFSMLLLSLFAAVALFLAAVGLYGVVAYTVSQRTQEIGVRMAIGAQQGDVLRMVLGSGMKLAALGVAIGVAAALALAGLVASMLFGVTPFDPASYGLTAADLLAVAALACYVPARRAMRVDPLIALRQE